MSFFESLVQIDVIIVRKISLGYIGKYKHQIGILMIIYLFPCYDYKQGKESWDLCMELQVTKKAIFFVWRWHLLMTLGIFISAGTSVYASDS